MMSTFFLVKSYNNVLVADGMTLSPAKDSWRAKVPCEKKLFFLFLD